MFDQSAEVANTTREEKSSGAAERLSSSDHLDTGEGNSPATGQIQVLDRDTNHALTVRAAFAPVREMAEGWLAKARAINVTSIEQVEEMTLARESRIGLSKVSGAIDRWHKEHKAEALARGREIDDIARDLKDIVTAARDMCRHQEEFAKRHEEARLAALRADRHALLIQHGANPGDYTDLAQISEDGWSALFAKVVRAAELEAAAKAEAARLAEVTRAETARLAAEAQEAERLERARQDAARLERERVQAEENARLKAEAEERDRRDALAAEALRIEREAAAAIAKAEREERDRVEARLAAEREAERQAAAHAAWVKDEAARVEREKVEAVARKAKEEHDTLLRRIADQEHRAKLEAAAEKERAEALAEEARLAPDREKLERLSLDLQTIARGEQVTIVVPVMATDAGRAALARILVNFGRLAASVVKEAGGL